MTQKEKDAKYYQQNKQRFAEKRKQRYEEKKEQIRESHDQYVAANKDKISKRNKKWRESNKALLKQKAADYYQANKDKCNAAEREYRRNNPEAARQYLIRNKEHINQLRRDRYNADDVTKISMKARTQIQRAVKYGATKEYTSMEYLGCTADELKQYLESKFQPGMTWENYGTWHIDHIRPLAKLKDNPDLISELCHYSNLQPLWATDNLSKGTKEKR